MTINNIDTKQASHRVTKNLATTILGIPITAAGIWLGLCLFIKPLEPYCPDCGDTKLWIRVALFLVTIVLGWAFLLAKDSLIEGLTLGIIKLKQK
jgi:hypothetical protein